MMAEGRGRTDAATPNFVDLRCVLAHPPLDGSQALCGGGSYLLPQRVDRAAAARGTSQQRSRGGVFTWCGVLV
jgi:hypothetical protein